MAESRSHAPGNGFGLAEAALGLVVGFLLSVLAVSAYQAIRGQHGSTASYGADIVSLLGLWVGLIAAAVAATRMRQSSGEGALVAPGPRVAPARPSPDALVARPSTGSIVEDYGLRIRPILDVPLGLAVGVGAQFLLIPALEAPLRPFVPHLDQRLGHPARQLLGGAHGPGLVVLAVLICLGSPVVEELFFRGLLLRGLIGRLRPLGRRAAPAASIVLTGIVFGLVHFEALQLLGLAGFGMVLGLLAWWTGRLGPSIVAHVAFNSTTVIFYVLTH